MGPSQAFWQVQMSAWHYATDWLLMAIPLYILLGQLVYRAGVAEELYMAVYKWLGKLPGGLAIATAWACAGFGAVSGSSPAAVGAMGAITYPIMKKFKYDPRLATACLAASGGLAILIPPSLAFVLYGVITETSIGTLFIAGIAPGILLSLLYAITIYIMCRRNPVLGPSGPSFPMNERIKATVKVWPVIVIFVAIIGGIYAGITTATEAAGVGVFITLVVFILMGRMSFEKFKLALIDTLKLTAMIMALVMGGMLIARFMATTGITASVVDTIANLSINRYLIFALIIAVYLILGAILDVMGMIVITMPVVFPLILQLGFDPIWFGVVVVIMMESALITPPIGANVFVMGGIAKEDIPLEKIFKAVIPFFFIQILLVVILTVFPEVVLWLPNLMSK